MGITRGERGHSMGLMSGRLLTGCERDNSMNTPVNSSDLAINGGTPVRADPMPARRAIGDSETAMIKEVLSYYQEQDADFGYQGHFEERYCEAFAKAQGGGYADAVTTGTAALYVALAALDLAEGSEVLVSPITDPGSVNAIILNRLIPRTMDSAPGSYNIGIDQVVERITPETKAVLIVHAAGRAVADIVSIVDVCRSKGIYIVEDCSQAHHASIDAGVVGNFGDIAAFSTMYRKAHITGATGGVVFSRDRELHRQAMAHADRICSRAPSMGGAAPPRPAHGLSSRRRRNRRGQGSPPSAKSREFEPFDTLRETSARIEKKRL